jgi:hypothetical protein
MFAEVGGVLATLLYSVDVIVFCRMVALAVKGAELNAALETTLARPGWLALSLA